MGVVWLYPSGSFGGARMGAPGKSGILVGRPAMIALAFDDVSFSPCVSKGSKAELCLSKGFWKASGTVLGEHGGVSGIKPPKEPGSVVGDASSSRASMSCTSFAAKGKRGELLSGSTASSHDGLAGSYSVS